MGFRIVIAGETQCLAYAESCLLADYLAQNLPNFCYTHIEKTVKEWKIWLCKINMKNKWHHRESPIVWKEMLMKGSKPCYIGGASEFLDYCYSYYNFDSLFASEKYDGLLANVLQLKKKLNIENLCLMEQREKISLLETKIKTHFVVTISGAGHLLAMHLISALMDGEVIKGEKHIDKIYLYDSYCSKRFMESIEKECYYVQSNYPGKVVKYVEKIGVALTHTDLLIILDHEPLNQCLPIGEWLRENRRKMKELALMINASASRKMYIIVANLGPACYNATILRKRVNINKSNIVVATSDLGLETLPIVAQIAEIPMRNIFCPPVWGFVGINHLVDIRTTVHKYNSFEPYSRYTKVKNSTLHIGSVTPEMRTLDYLMHFDTSLWKKVTEMKCKMYEIHENPIVFYTLNPFLRTVLSILLSVNKMHCNGQWVFRRTWKKKNYSRDKESRVTKALAVINLVNLWLLHPSPDHIICLGIRCNGTFGLNFNGIFSQPARFIDEKWMPAQDFLMPKDRQIKLSYLVKMAELVMGLKADALPEIIKYHPCICKTKYVKRDNL